MSKHSRFNKEPKRSSLTAEYLQGTTGKDNLIAELRNTIAKLEKELESLKKVKSDEYLKKEDDQQQLADLSTSEGGSNV